LITSTVAKRYARAFFDVAGEEKRYEDYYGDLSRFAAIIEENGQLRDFLANPVFEKADKRRVVDKILEKIALARTTANFLRLLVEKGRIGHIAEILENYRRLMDKAIGIARVDVKTAYPLAPDLSANLQQALESLTGQKVEMKVEEDASLLGGIVVRWGDKLYDGSIKMQLQTMRKLLGEEI